MKNSYEILYDSKTRIEFKYINWRVLFAEKKDNSGPHYNTVGGGNAPLTLAATRHNTRRRSRRRRRAVVFKNPHVTSREDYFL